MFGKAYIRNLWDYNYRENGIAFAIVFDGIQADVPQCTLESSISDPLVGEDLTFTATTIREGGSNMVYDVIPFELLYADSQSPAITVKVDDIEALCVGLNCDYTYTIGFGEWTAQTLSGKQIMLTGADLPTENFDIIFGETSCDLNTLASDGTNAECTLLAFPSAGSWNAELRSNLGNIPMNVAVTQIDVVGSVSSVSPNTDLNENGGDTLTITGTGFSTTSSTSDSGRRLNGRNLPAIISNNVVTLSDGTLCTVVTSTDTTITCVTEPLNSASIDYVNGYDITVETYAVSATGTITATLYGTKLDSDTVTPNSLSPILKQWVTVTLKSDYPETLSNTNQFTATLVCTDVDCDYTPTAMWINSVDDGTKSMTVKFPGAPSGNYKIEVTSAA